MTETLEQTLTAYDTWLDRQPPAEKTRVDYRFQVHQYGAHLAQLPPTADNLLHTPFARDYAIRDHKTYLKTERQAKPTSVNLALAPIDHFHQFIGNDRPHVQRESLPAQAPRALKPKEHNTFLRAIERTSSVRDKAITQLLFYTAICLGECSALNLDDVRTSSRKGVVIIRSGKGDTYREVPLNAEVREALGIWLKERSKRFSQTPDPAPFLNLKWRRLSARAIDLIIRQIGAGAHLELSAHVLRHTCLTNLVRHGNDLVLVAEIARRLTKSVVRIFCCYTYKNRTLRNQLERYLGTLKRSGQVIGPYPDYLSGTLRSCEWAESAAVGLLSIWWWFAYLYGHVIGPATDTARTSNYSSTLHTAPAARSSNATAPSYHVACETWPSFEFRAYTHAGRTERRADAR